MSYVIPPALDKMTEKMTNKSPDMSGSREAIVLPLNKDSSQNSKYTLHKGREIERKIPSGGGMRSIVVLEDDGQQERTSTFQAWVTETEAYIINTKEDVSTIKAVDYASTLVSENVGFREENMALTISGDDVTKLKNGQSTDRCDFYNGVFRITEEGVVFLLPNKYEHNQAN